MSTDWPHENSDLNPDPSMVFGRLNNGFRYIMKVNSEPKNRVALFLDVQAGSLFESDEQRGLAHFLEHMLFNGTKNFPAGKLVEYFQSIGMNFGGDTNAHTTYDETVYNVVLPGNSLEEIDKGLLVMSDYSRGALVPESEVERERGVILSEKRARDSASYRTHVATTRFTMRGTKIPERMPIGIEETLKKADRKLLLDFYNSWYRPENMVLVMVGDFDPDLVKPLVEKRFSHLESGAPVQECPQVGQPDHKGIEFFYHYEPEEGATEISIESVWAEKKQNDSFKLQKKNLQEYAVALLVRHRFEKMLESGSLPFTSGNYYSGNFLHTIGYASIHVKTSPDTWRQSLEELEQVLRRALKFGFSDEELKRVKKELEAMLDSAVLTANTRNSTELANDIISHLNKNKVFMSPSQEKKLFMGVVENITREDVHEELKRTWSHNNRLISLTGNTKISDDRAVDVIQATYKQSKKKKVSQAPSSSKVRFPYLELPENIVKPKEVIDLAEINAEKLIYPNGVVVNLKQTPFKKNSISIVADIGNGKRSEPFAGMGLLAESVINGSGTGTLKESELRTALAGSTVKLRFKVGHTSFRWIGDCVTKDVEQLFQLLQAVVVDPGMRKDVYKVNMDNFQQMYKQLDQDVEGSLQLHVNRFLGGGNDFFGLESWEEFSKIKFEQIKSWMLPLLADTSLEISIVGDFDREKILKLASEYLSNLPTRKENSIQNEQIKFPVGQTLRLDVGTSIEKTLVVIGWPTDDFWDINRTRRLHMLASVFRDRLRKVIREKLGATYSPVVYNDSSRIFPGYGVMKVMLIVDPEREEMVRGEVLKIADELREKGVSDDELVRAKAPSLTSIKDMLRTNRYWRDSVLSLSSRYPIQLRWPTTILSEFNAITKEELSKMAAKYLVKEKSAAAIVSPR